MASTDYPLSVSSKFVDDAGTEHLVTVRGRNLEDFQGRLNEAGHIFPYAGFSNGHASPKKPAPQTEEQPTPIRQPDVNRLPANGSDRAPKCSVHSRPMRPSKHGGWYCSAKNGDGTYCQVHAA